MKLARAANLLVQVGEIEYVLQRREEKKKQKQNRRNEKCGKMEWIKQNELSQIIIYTD